MNILSIDTASNVCSVSLLNNTTIIKELHLKNGKTQSENLVPLLKELMDDCNMNFSDINLIAIDKGPGSFTGIRIGVSTIKAIAEIYKINVIGVSSLQSLAFNDDCKNNTIISLIDARNNQVYCGVFNGNDRNECLCFADDINTTLNKITSFVTKDSIFVGDGGILHKQIITDFFKMPIQFSKNNEQSSVSTGIAGLNLFNSGVYETADTIMPFYLRKSQAERMKDLNNNGNNK